MPERYSQDKRNCKHEPDWDTLAHGESPDPIAIPVVMDVSCVKCGLSGSAGITAEDIDW